jgi:hypothetical protein
MNDINTANKTDEIYTNMYNAPINNNEIIFVVGDNPTVTFNNNVTVYTYNPTVYEVAEVAEVAEIVEADDTTLDDTTLDDTTLDDTTVESNYLKIKNKFIKFFKNIFK